MSKSLPGAKRRLAVIAGLLALVVVTVAVVAAALLRTPDTSHPRDAELQAKADEFTEKVAAEEAAAEKAELEAKTVLVPFSKSGPLRALYAGDSLTAGFAATADKNTFRALTVAQLQKQGSVQATVAGKPGLTTAEVATEATQGGGYGLVIVELGTNDVDKTPDFNAFKQSYADLIKTLRAKSPKAGLICLGPWHANDKAEKYNTFIEATCTAAGGRFRPLSSYFQSEQNRWINGLMPDGKEVDNFHPNDNGHKAIATQIMSAVRYS